MVGIIAGEEEIGTLPEEAEEAGGPPPVVGTIIAITVVIMNVPTLWAHAPVIGAAKLWIDQSSKR